jgi:NADPH:quinone reductase-like Zn-dependent oxidoreductase
MKALLLHNFGEPARIEFAECPSPKPGLDEVLIKITASPINPSDLVLLAGLNPIKRALPCVPGFEGSGKVIASGGGIWADSLVGRNVACRAKPAGGGAWAEFMVTDASRCIPLNDDISVEDASMLLVNPLTAWALIDSAITHRHQAAIQTAAAGALGKMILRLAHARQFSLINVVRRKEQKKALEDLGAQHILICEDPDFEPNLKELCAKLSATVCFEAVAGDLANKVLRAMPNHSELWSYGGLSNQALEIDPMSLIYEDKYVRGFWGPQTLYNSPQKLNQAVGEIQDNISSIFKTDIKGRFQLKEFHDALRLYKKAMGSGKMIFVMDSHEKA